MIVEIELQTKTTRNDELKSDGWISGDETKQIKRKETYLQHFVGQSENDGIFLHVEPDQELHVPRPHRIGEGPSNIAVQRLLHVVGKVLEKVDLSLQRFWMFLQRDAASRVDVRFPDLDVIKVAAV